MKRMDAKSALLGLSGCGGFDIMKPID